MTENKTRKRKRRACCNSISYTTGDIGLNIDRFNQAFGTAEGNEAGIGGDALSEAKRYVRRYYLRPQNIFASNKAEVLKALVDIGEQNCTIYTLNNLEDNEKDVSKLGSRDIIYTYDDGILKDKNGIRVLDYDLSIKKEENRKKLTNPDPNSKEFRAEYEDRMTAATELEENFNDDILATCPYDAISADYNNIGDKFIVSLNNNTHDIETTAKELIKWVEKNWRVSVLDWNTNGHNVFIFELRPDNEFDMDFDDINVYGEKLNEAKEHYCAKCGEPIDDNGHNSDAGLVCDGCYLHFGLEG